MSPAEEGYAQIEKEALAFSWACKRFSLFLIGLKFSIQTDHKPLITLFSTKQLEELSVRVQRFRLQMLWFDFTIVCIPGKSLVIADTLSRAPLLEPDEQDKLIRASASSFEVGQPACINQLVVYFY